MQQMASRLMLWAWAQRPQASRDPEPQKQSTASSVESSTHIHLHRLLLDITTFWSCLVTRPRVTGVRTRKASSLRI